MRQRSAAAATSTTCDHERRLHFQFIQHLRAVHFKEKLRIVFLVSHALIEQAAERIDELFARRRIVLQLRRSALLPSLFSPRLPRQTFSNAVEQVAKGVFRCRRVRL